MKRPRLTRLMPVGFVGALALICLLEGAIKHVDVYLMTPDQSIARATKQNVGRWSKGRSLLVFGDSQAKQSIAPREIEAVLGKSGRNLALAGSQAANSYFLLRDALASGATPDLVIVDFFPPLQRLSHWHVIENDPYLLSLTESIELAWEARDPAFLASILARKTLASFRLRHSIRTLATNRIKREGLRDWVIPSQVLLRNHTANEGAQVHPATIVTDQQIEAINASYFPRWEVWELQERYMRRFLDLAQAHHLKVAWLMPPFHPYLQTRTELSGFDARWTEYVQSWAARYPNLRVVDGRGLNYPPEFFLDPNHLAGPGMTAFSQNVARVVPQLHSGVDRRIWYRIDDRIEGPPVSLLEDVSASNQAIHQEMKAAWVAARQERASRRRR